MRSAPEPATDATGDGEALSAPLRFRRGWMLGDGTGCGKGRQVAAIILDHWLRGRRRALWLSASDKLLEDARRDWAAIGGSEADLIPLGKFRQGAEVPQEAGILFATYATLRSPARQGKSSRLEQIVGWFADGMDEASRQAYGGVIVFDEAHAMANAAGSKGSRGDTAPSQQGRAGLRLQNALPDARILYVSATGATTVPGLAYARRLGLWGGADSGGETPFEQRTDFVTAMEAGGVAAMEVVARDLKALGLYQARALSYDGVEVELLEHPLTPEQRRIYDAYAGAFKVIHRNLEDALKATLRTHTWVSGALSECCSASNIDPTRSYEIKELACRSASNLRADQHAPAQDRRPRRREGRAHPHPLRFGLSRRRPVPPAGRTPRGLRPLTAGASCPENPNPFNPKPRHYQPQIPAPQGAERQPTRA